MALEKLGISDLESLKSSKSATLTMAEVAVLMGVHPRTVSAGIDQGTIPAIRIGRRIVIPREPLLALLTSPHAKQAS